MNHSLEFVNSVTGACTNEIEGCWTLSKLHCPQFNRHRLHFEGVFFVPLVAYSCKYRSFLSGYLAHYVVKRHFKFHKDPFAKFFREGVQCWIPLRDREVVQFEFIRTQTPEEEKAEMEEIKEKMKKYLEEKMLKSIKRKKKRLAWKEKMKAISDKKELLRRQKENKKIQKMTKKQKEDYYEKERKKAVRKNAILMKRVSAKRVRAALEYSRAKTFFPDGSIGSSLVDVYNTPPPSVDEVVSLPVKDVSSCPEGISSSSKDVPRSKGISTRSKRPPSVEDCSIMAKKARSSEGTATRSKRPPITKRPTVEECPIMPKKTRNGRTVSLPERFR